jgi:hypothetical protein
MLLCCHSVVTLFLLCSYSVLTLFLLCCYSVVTLLLLCCYSVVTLLLLCCCSVVTLLLLCCYSVVPLLSGSRSTSVPPRLVTLRERHQPAKGVFLHVTAKLNSSHPCFISAFLLSVTVFISISLCLALCRFVYLFVAHAFITRIYSQATTRRLD